MYELKAFAHIGALVDNNRAVVAPIGELSPTAISYSREKEYYSNATAPGQGLVVFSSKRDGKVEKTSSVLAASLINISKWAYAQALAGGFNSGTESFRTAFVVQFGTTFSLYATGVMVKADNNVYMPSYIEVRDPVNDDLRYRVWYSSEAFEQQFDEYEIKVVGPIDELDAFFQGALTVKEQLAGRTQDVTFEQVQAAKEGYPETFLRSEMFEWYDPNNKAIEFRIATYWNVVIYGVAGNNIDAIKEALRAYILANSTHTKDEWALIFPEIFTATEFICVPLWGQPSITNKVIATGLYSSITKMKLGMEQLKRLTRGEGYTTAWIEAHGEFVGTSHKAVNMVVIGGPKNRDGVVELYMRYPDYINVLSTGNDFMRMKPETRRFVLALEELLITAEVMTPDSSIPVKFSRMVRDGVLYVVQTVDKFQFLVASRYSYEDTGIGKASAAGEPQIPK
jgi:hypothetical protein